MPTIVASQNGGTTGDLSEHVAGHHWQSDIPTLRGGRWGVWTTYKVGPYPIITPINGLLNRVITPFITRRGPLCRLLRKNWQQLPQKKRQPPIHFGILSFPGINAIIVWALFFWGVAIQECQTWTEIMGAILLDPTLGWQDCLVRFA